MICSECGQETYSSIGWHKLIIKSLGVTAVPAIYRPNGYAESDPYMIFCPDCYQKKFGDIKKKIDVTSVETKEVTWNI